MPSIMGWGDDGSAQVQRDDGSIFTLPAQLAQMFLKGTGIGGGPSQGTMLTPPEFQPPAPPAPPPMPEPTMQVPVPKRQWSMDTGPERAQAANAMARTTDTQNQMAQMQLGQKQVADQTRMQGIQDRQESADEAYQQHEERLKEIKGRTDQLRSEIDDYSKQQVDPNSFFNHTSTWGKVAMGVSMAISGFLNPRGPNMAFQAINQLIEHDMQAQESNLKRKGEALGMKQRLLGEDVAQENDLFKSREARSAMAWNLVKEQADIQQNQTTDPMAKKNAQLLKDMADQKIQQFLYDGVTKDMDRREKVSAAYATVEAAKQRGKDEMAQQIQKQAYESYKAPMEAAKAFQKISPDGVPKGEQVIIDPYRGTPVGVVKDGEAENMRAFVLNSQRVDQAMSGMLALSGKNYHPDLPGWREQNVRKIETYISEMQLAELLTDKLNSRGGRWAAVIELAKTGAKPETWFTPDNVEKIKLAQNLMRQRVWLAAKQRQNFVPWLPAPEKMPGIDDLPGAAEDRAARSGGEAEVPAAPASAPQGNIPAATSAPTPKKKEWGVPHAAQ